MEKRLQLAHKEQTDMIAAIAHDLKAPLTSISGFAELLAMHKGLLENEKQEYYELIQKKSKYMDELINDFMSFTKEKLNLESVNQLLNIMVEKSMHIFLSMADLFLYLKIYLQLKNSK